MLISYQPKRTISHERVILIKAPPETKPHLFPRQLSAHQMNERSLLDQISSAYYTTTTTTTTTT